jgi:hypothetical protein
MSKMENYLFWFTPKCACTSTKNILWDAEAALGHCRPIDDKNFVHQRAVAPNSPWLTDSMEIERELIKSSERFSFTFVRNPYARILSCYSVAALTPGVHPFFRLSGWSEDRRPDFIEFLELLRGQPAERHDHHWRPLSKLIPFNDIEFDFIGSVENFEEDIIRALVGAFNTNVKVRTDEFVYYTGYGSRLSLLDEKSIKLIMEIYEQDFYLFGYSKDPHVVFPDREKISKLTNKARHTQVKSGRSEKIARIGDDAARAGGAHRGLSG